MSRSAELAVVIAAAVVMAVAGYLFGVGSSVRGGAENGSGELQRVRQARAEAAELRKQYAAAIEQCAVYSNKMLAAQAELKAERDANEPLRTQMRAINEKQHGLLAQIEEAAKKMSDLEEEKNLLREKIRQYELDLQKKATPIRGDPSVSNPPAATGVSP